MMMGVVIILSFGCCDYTLLQADRFPRYKFPISIWKLFVMCPRKQDIVFTWTDVFGTC